MSIDALLDVIFDLSDMLKGIEMLGPAPKFRSEVDEFLATHQAFLPKDFRKWAIKFNTMREMWDALENPEWCLRVLSQINHKNYRYALLKFTANCVSLLNHYAQTDFINSAVELIVDLTEEKIDGVKFSEQRRAYTTVVGDYLNHASPPQTEIKCLQSCRSILNWITSDIIQAARHAYGDCLTRTEESWPIFATGDPKVYMSLSAGTFPKVCLKELKKLIGNPFLQAKDMGLTDEGYLLY